MKEKILEIINNGIELSLAGNYKSVYIDGQDKTAKEIYDLFEYEKEHQIRPYSHLHYMKFVEWIKDECDVIIYKWMQDEATLEEVYQYWRIMSKPPLKLKSLPE